MRTITFCWKIQPHFIFILLCKVITKANTVDMNAQEKEGRGNLSFSVRLALNQLYHLLFPQRDDTKIMPDADMTGLWTMSVVYCSSSC